MNTERLLKKLLKILFATHHFTYHSKDLDEIAHLVRIKRKTLDGWMTSPAWHEALMLWGYSPDIGDLKVAERVWSLMIESGHDLLPINFPEDLGRYIAQLEEATNGKEN